jgi:hypothetical protein
MCYFIVSAWVYVNSRPSAFGSAGRMIGGMSYHTGMETVDTMLLTRTSGSRSTNRF